MNNIALPLVSFIIPTLNAQSLLPLCLKSIKGQKYPKNKIEIIVADGGSTDNTITIAKSYGARVIQNPLVLHEPGKSKASKVARGKIFFYLDSDNILSDNAWISHMVKPFLNEKNILGLLPQTLPPPHGGTLNKYLGYLFTDPFTWFVYGNEANPKDYHKVYKPIKTTRDYALFSFTKGHYPLFGLSQGVGTASTFNRSSGFWDDLLAGMELMKSGSVIAYIPHAGIYHYHVKNVAEFIKKYQWRIRNNLYRHVPGMGLPARKKYLDPGKKIRIVLFPLYAFSIVFPFVDSLILSMRYKDMTLLLHLPMTLLLGLLILWETCLYMAGVQPILATYGNE